MTAAGSALRASHFTMAALQRAQRRGRPRGGLWWLGRCWTAPSHAAPLWQPQRALLPPLTGRRTTASSPLTSASVQAIVRRRDKKEAQGARCHCCYWRDRGEVLKKTTAASETVSLNFLNFDSNSALQVFDGMIWHEEKNFWSWDLVR